MNTAERPGPGLAAGTVLDRLLASLRAKAASLDGETRPAAVLWTDPREEWRPLVDEACVAAAVRHLLQPWLEESARAFQAAVERKPLPGAGEQPSVTVEDYSDPADGVFKALLE